MASIFEIYTLLHQHYGLQGWWPLLDRAGSERRCLYLPEFSSKALSDAERFEICTGAILTQNTNWQNAERALISLLEAGALNADALSRMDNGEIARLIKSSGYFNQKAKKLASFARFYLENPPADRELFLNQWGLGPETVDDMLLYAYHVPVFVVDLYTKRLFSRLGFCSETISYHDLQKLISDHLEQDALLFKEYHALIVRNAKDHCSKKPQCVGCPLEQICPGQSAMITV